MKKHMKIRKSSIEVSSEMKPAIGTFRFLMRGTIFNNEKHVHLPCSLSCPNKLSNRTLWIIILIELPRGLFHINPLLISMQNCSRQQTIPIGGNWTLRISRPHHDRSLEIVQIFRIYSNSSLNKRSDFFIQKNIANLLSPPVIHRISMT